MLRAYQGYTFRTLCEDIEEFPEWFGGALATISARNMMEDIEQTGGKLEKKDIGTPKGAQWAGGRGRDRDNKLAGAHATLNEKFPGMM